MAGALCCSGCRTELPVAWLYAAGFNVCPQCRADVELIYFPSLAREQTVGTLGERVMLDDEASCFYHEARRAIIPCDNCGRFLCNLCDLELAGRHLCPQCLEADDQVVDDELQRGYTSWDAIALSLAIAPLLCFPFTIITAPMALYLVCRHWRTRCSLLPRSRIRFLIAGACALLTLLGWIVIPALIFYNT